MTAAVFSFTVWVQDDGGEFNSKSRRVIMHRVPGRSDQPNHEALKEYVLKQVQVYSPNARIEFGPISLVGPIAE